MKKTCYNPECAEENPQPLENFHKQSIGKHGRNARCRVCVTAAQLKREMVNPSTRYNRRDNHYKRTYGISIKHFEMLLAAQDGKCAICGTTDSGNPRTGHLVVDHIHGTHRPGNVRGLLCSVCNQTLGLMDDDAARIRKAADYLEAR